VILPPLPECLCLRVTIFFSLSARLPPILSQLHSVSSDLPKVLIPEIIHFSLPFFFAPFFPDCGPLFAFLSLAHLLCSCGEKLSFRMPRDWLSSSLGSHSLPPSLFRPNPFSFSRPMFLPHFTPSELLPRIFSKLRLVGSSLRYVSVSSLDFASPPFFRYLRAS